MNIVVTGGAGYIGSVVTARLIEAGHTVTVVDNLSRGFKEAVSPKARFIKADITELSKVISADDNIEAVIHLAAYAYVGESTKKPDIYWDNNAVSTVSMLGEMRKLDIKKLVFASTCATYGDPDKTPITEDMPTKPVNPYGMTKLAMDMAITSEAEAYGLAATSLRFFNVAGAYGEYGERHNPETHIIPLAIAASAGRIPQFSLFGDDYPTHDGSCIRDYIHVVDLAMAIETSLAKLKLNKHSIYNLGNGAGFSNKEVIAAVEEVTGKKLKIKVTSRRSGDPAVLIASSEKIKRELGWMPERPSLKDMVQDAWEFYKTLHA